MIRVIVIFAIFGIFGCAGLRHEYHAQREYQALNAVSTNTLQTFANEAELRRYLRQVQRIQKRASAQFSTLAPENLLAQLEPACQPGAECTELDSLELVGRRIVQAPMDTIPDSGIDERDAVVQIGDYLLALQDGRLFVINAKSFKLTQRMDVYLPPNAPAREDSEHGPSERAVIHYDEMFAYKNFVITIAYNHDDKSRELSVFALNAQSGTLRRHSTHQIPMGEYYLNNNNASRLRGDSLVLNSMANLAEREGMSGKFGQARPNNTVQNKRRAGLPATSIYKPLLRVLEPYLHQVTHCDLSMLVQGQDIRCRTIGFVGPYNNQLYISPEYIYLWLTSGDYWGNSLRCEQLGFQVNAAIAARDVPLAAVYRISLKTSATSVASARGIPGDQFHLDDYQHQLRALVDWYYGACYFPQDEEVPQKRFLSISNGKFGQHFEAPLASRFVELPALAGDAKARFIEDWLVYGATQENGPPELGQENRVLTQAYVFNQNDSPQSRRRL